MIKNLAVTFRNAVKHAIIEGQIRAEKHVIERRIERCKRCEYFSNRRCTECGCFVITKAGLKVSECPKNYWND